MGGKILIISGHDFRSRRKANIHFIAKELANTQSVRFLSIGFSNLSLLKGDSRCELASEANRVCCESDIECFLWKTFIHPSNIGSRSLRWLERAHFDLYRTRLPEVALRWIGEAGTVILESGLSVLFIELIRKINPLARLIYNASDDLSAISCSTYLQSELDRLAGCLDWVRLPSRALASKFRSDVPVYFIPHGVDVRLRDQVHESPFERGTHAVSVGSMLFDESFFVLAADQFPEVQFHVIGAGKTGSALARANIQNYGEMKHAETVKFIKHAKFCIAPYRRNDHAEYLADTSMKLLQYDFLGVPAVCPSFVAGDRPYRFGYEPGDKASIRRAILAAMRQGKHKGTEYLSWADVTKRLLNPLDYPDTRLRPTDRPRVAA
ncbi:UDP-glucuronate--glycolipid 2-beta-glucuronosyltransferase [Beijerinckiaceae bacterium]|nr:UDP-glucuronate--glycolipid 2-beta-glucuronosyltransferase [Beijerinckiaceae bacterium]